MRIDVHRALFAAGAMVALGCGSGVTPSTSSSAGTDAMGISSARPGAQHDEDQGNSPFHIVPRDARVAGKTTLQWIPEFWRYIMSLPASVNPELNASAECSVGQSGPVFFLPGFQARVFTRSCTVRAHTPVLYTIQSLLNDYPCPDPTFQPAPGQTLEAFLAEGAKAFDDAITNMHVTIDGQPIDPAPYRYLTGLFSFTGDPSLTATLDNCVTGSSQVGVADGWFVVLRLSPGDHTLLTTYVNPGGHDTSMTFLVHVLDEGDD